jgi:hypothetical protein
MKVTRVVGVVELEVVCIRDDEEMRCDGGCFYDRYRGQMFLSGILKCDRLSENLNSAGYGLLENMLMENDGICATGAMFYNR